MEGFRALVKTTKVREADRYLQLETCIISPDLTIFEVAVRVTKHPEARVISVVDRQGKLLGLIRSRVLFEDIFFQVMPEEFLADATGYEKIAEFARLSSARTARDVMQPPVSVTMDDTIKDAFMRMHDNTLAGIPIVDSQMHVVGYLDMLELMIVLLKSYIEQVGGLPGEESTPDR